MAQASRKAPKKKTSHRSKPTPGWVWLLAGLGIGLSVALFTYVKDRKLQAPSAKIPAPLSKHGVAKKQDHKAPTKPKFDFYTILPEMEVIVPEQEVQGATTPEGVRQVEQPGTYLLQAGSFRTREQADHLRARLALLGVETDVQTVTVDNKQTWHRVRVGPFHNLRDLNTARSLLKKNGIDAILIRLAG